MKPVALVLLVANILVAGYFLFADFRATSEGNPVREQVNADSIRVIATGSRVGALMRPQPADAGPDAPRSCASWGVFPEGQFASVEARLAALDLGARLSRGDGGASSYLVLILPIPRRADLNRRVEELIRSGVTDQFVINDGEYRGGVSLGYFKSEDAANRHLNALKAKGVSDAVVRPRLSGGRPATMLMRDLSAAERARIEAIAADFPGVELRMQPCPAPSSG